MAELPAFLKQYHIRNIKLTLVNVIRIGFCFVLIEACNRVEPTPQAPKISHDQCEIVSILDSTISGPFKTVQFNFTCQDNNHLMEYNFLENNPWYLLDFPYLTDKNNPAKTNRSRIEGIKQGRLSFDLKNSTFEHVKAELPELSNENARAYFFTSARTNCLHKNYSPRGALVNYNLWLFGTKDTVSRMGSNILFYTGELTVFNTQGERQYHIVCDNYAASGAEIDTVSQLLFFRRSTIRNNVQIEGIEIHDVAKKKLLYRIEYDSTLHVGQSGFLVGRYILFSVMNLVSLREFFLYDIKKKLVLKYVFTKNHEFNSPRITNHSIILMTEESHDATAVYDTLSIDDFEKVDSLE